MYMHHGKKLCMRSAITRVIILPIVLLLGITLVAHEAGVGHNRIKIRCTLLDSLDKFKIVNTNNIDEFIRQIKNILLTPFTAPDGRKFNLAELAQLEREGHVPTAVCQKLVKTILTRVVAISQPHMHDLRHHKQALEKIIIAWKEQSGRRDTLLNAWSEVEPESEHEFLEERVSSLAVTYTFLSELHDFLSDLVYSCPHSREFHTRHMVRDKSTDTHI